MLFYLYCVKPNPKEIVYIGITSDLNRRIKEHKKNFPGYKVEVIATSYSDFWVRKLELLLIDNYKPFIENKQLNILNKNDMGEGLPMHYYEEIEDYEEIEFTDQLEKGEWLNK